MTGLPREPAPTAARAALDQLGRIPLADESMPSLLHNVADLAQQVMPGEVEVSVTLLRPERGITAVHTGPLALELDESQYGQGHGPCLDAAVGGEVVEIVDGRSEDRWPDYIQTFLDRGAGSCLCVPLPVQQVPGALNIYARRPSAFTDEDRQTAVEFASYAAVAVSNMASFDSARALAENLQVAMEYRAVIEQAKGILIERHKLTADQAFRLLAQVSMHTNIKVRDVADRLVHTGELDVQAARGGPGAARVARDALSPDQSARGRRGRELLR